MRRFSTRALAEGVNCSLLWDDCGVTGWLMEAEATGVDVIMCNSDGSCGVQQPSSLREDKDDTTGEG